MGTWQVTVWTTYDTVGIDSAVLRFDGDTIAVICMDTKAALKMMQRAVEEMTTPEGVTKQ